jgi:hypothetical protein
MSEVASNFLSKLTNFFTYNKIEISLILLAIIIIISVSRVKETFITVGFPDFPSENNKWTFPLSPDYNIDEQIRLPGTNPLAIKGWQKLKRELFDAPMPSLLQFFPQESISVYNNCHPIEYDDTFPKWGNGGAANSQWLVHPTSEPII